MKKLLAILLSALILLSACAAAEAAKLTVKNVAASANGAVLFDLSGLDVELAVGTEDGRSGVSIALTSGGQDVERLTLAAIGSTVALFAGGLTDVYTLSIEQAAGILGQATGELDIEDAIEDASQAMSPADAAAIEELAAAVQAAFAAGVTDGGAGELDGVPCEITLVELSEEQLSAVLDALVKLLDNHKEQLAGSGISSFSELRAALDPKLSVSGEAYETEDEECLNLTFTLTAAGLPAPATLEVYVECMEGAAEGETSTGLAFVAGMGESAYTLTLALETAQDDLAWIPAELGETVDVLTMDQAQLQKLQSEAMAMLMRVMSTGMTVIQQNLTAAQG